MPAGSLLERAEQLETRRLLCSQRRRQALLPPCERRERGGTLLPRWAPLRRYGRMTRVSCARREGVSIGNPLPGSQAPRLEGRSRDCDRQLLPSVDAPCHGVNLLVAVASTCTCNTLQEGSRVRRWNGSRSRAGTAPPVESTQGDGGGEDGTRSEDGPTVARPRGSRLGAGSRS